MEVQSDSNADFGDADEGSSFMREAYQQIYSRDHSMAPSILDFEETSKPSDKYSHVSFAEAIREEYLRSNALLKKAEEQENQRWRKSQSSRARDQWITKALAFGMGAYMIRQALPTFLEETDFPEAGLNILGQNHRHWGNVWHWLRYNV